MDACDLRSFRVIDTLLLANAREWCTFRPFASAVYSLIVLVEQRASSMEIDLVEISAKDCALISLKLPLVE